MEFSENKFRALTTKQQHKVAAKALNFYHEHADNLVHLKRYNQIAESLGLSSIGHELGERQKRYEWHMRLSEEERDSSLANSQHDSLAATSFGLVDVYLDNLRSAHNVGSIMRSLEAFRLGSLLLSPLTPGPENSKVEKASMGTSPIVPCKRLASPALITKKPLIAIEVHDKAASLDTFTFPKACTLIFGNEAYGISQELLDKADHIVSIPLIGGKNSLNVANSFAIIAATISRQRRLAAHV